MHKLHKQIHQVQRILQLLAARRCLSVFQQIKDTNTEYDWTNQNMLGKHAIFDSPIPLPTCSYVT